MYLLLSFICILCGIFATKTILSIRTFPIKGTSALLTGLRVGYWIRSWQTLQCLRYWHSVMCWATVQEAVSGLFSSEWDGGLLSDRVYFWDRTVLLYIRSVLGEWNVSLEHGWHDHHKRKRKCREKNLFTNPMWTCPGSNPFFHHWLAGDRASEKLHGYYSV